MSATTMPVSRKDFWGENTSNAAVRPRGFSDDLRALVLSESNRDKFYNSFISSPMRMDTSIVSKVETLIEVLVRSWIAIPFVSEVRDYLLRYPDIIDVLWVASRTAVEKFASKAQLSLELYQDPEINDEYLALYVRQSQYSEEIMSEIEEARKTYLGHLVGKKGWFVLTTDFLPPR